MIPTKLMTHGLHSIRGHDSEYMSAYNYSKPVPFELGCAVGERMNEEEEEEDDEGDGGVSEDDYL